MTSDDMLDLLAKVGAPRVSRRDDGTWYAVLKLPVPEGCTAEINSDFGHSTHRDALDCVVQRLASMRKTLVPGVVSLPSQ
jgi:hypothetical protein